MPYDVEVVLRVLLGSPDGRSPITNPEALSHIRLLDDDTRQRWHVNGRHDHRFPGTGPLYLTFNWDGGNIILLNKHSHEWAMLEGFPHCPTVNSQGTAYFSNLNYPPCGYTGNHKWYGSWFVNRKALHNNLPLVDPNSSWIKQAIDSCSDDTGWRYDTSSGIGGSGGAGLGGGYQHQNLVFMRKEPNDVRRWVVTLNAAGVGLTTPGVSVGGSTESAPSTALTELRSGPGGKKPFPITDLAGAVLFFDGGGGVGVGVSKAGAGVGVSTTTYLFLGGSYADGTMPLVASVKAILQTLSSSGSGGKSGGLVSAGAAGLVYAGRGTVKQR